MDGELIRRQAVLARRDAGLGRIRLTRRPAWSVLGLAAVALVGGLVLATVTLELPLYLPARGRIVPEGGPLPVRSPRPGVLSELRVDAGDRVGADQVLAVVAAGPDPGSRIRALRGREAALAAAVRSLTDSARRSSARRARQAEAAESRLELAVERLGLLEAKDRLQSRRAGRVRELLATGMLPAARGEEVAAESLALAIEIARAEEAVARAEAQLTGADAAAAVDRLQTEASRARLEAERADVAAAIDAIEDGARQLIRAPADATVLNLVHRAGETVATGTRLFDLLPEGESLAVHVAVDAGTAGIVQVGQAAVLRVHAYPYRQYGALEGRVIGVSRNSLPRAEAGLSGTGRVYRVRIALPPDPRTRDGSTMELRPGMAVDAKILLRRWPVYRWLLDRGGA